MTEAEIDKQAMILWDYNQMNHELKPAAAIVALGSMDLRVAERAAEIWHQKLAPVVVASGGFGRLTAAKWPKTEAENFAEVIYSCGVPERCVWIESESTNTAENLINSMNLLISKGVEPMKLILVTKPYMQRRAYAHFKKLYPGKTAMMASPLVSYADYPSAAISKELMINIMVGDTQRIATYPNRGFTIPQDIPDEVDQAMNKLIKQGYNKQLPN